MVTAHGDRVDADLIVAARLGRATVAAASVSNNCSSPGTEPSTRAGEPLSAVFRRMEPPRQSARNRVAVAACRRHSARVTLFDTAADTTDNGIAEMFHVLGTAIDDLAGGHPSHHRTAALGSWRWPVTSEGRPSHRRHRSPRRRGGHSGPTRLHGPPNKTHRAGPSVVDGGGSVIGTVCNAKPTSPTTAVPKSSSPPTSLLPAPTPAVCS